MSKVAAYLQEHILGEVTTRPDILNAMSTDASVLSITPEMVIYPRVTNDVRKVARFAWQLAEKGHVLPITPRGNGSDLTGAAIGKGISLVFPPHMSKIFELDSKQKLIRLQPGVNGYTLNSALSLHGLMVPALPSNENQATVGGAVANNATSDISGKYGDMGEWVHQLEVVLANGDILQTERLNKRDVNKRKGLQTFEGEIYRNIDNLIEDNKALIDSLAVDVPDNVGYTSIAKVKQKDGSIDLTPLFVGSQGTLGIVSEMILKTEFMSATTAMAVLAFGSADEARDSLDALRQLDPAFLEYYDGQLFTNAAEHGKSYEFYRKATDNGEVEAVLAVGFDDFNERARGKKLKKIEKILQNSNVYMITSDDVDSEELLAVRGVTDYLRIPAQKDVTTPPLVDGAYVPPERFEEFAAAVKALAEKHRVSLPIYGRALDNIYSTRAGLQLKKVGDKQKIFKLLDEYTALVENHGGHLIGTDGEGRVKSRFAHRQLGDDLQQLFTDIKNIFDPHGILNPGVKQSVELKTLVSQLQSDYLLKR